MKKKVSFVVTMEVEGHEEETPICESSLRENLFNAVEHERCEGTLTASDISANWIEVEALN